MDEDTRVDRWLARRPRLERTYTLAYIRFWAAVRAVREFATRPKEAD